MQIVIDHLTRMQSGYCCVAGIERATGRHVRPVLDSRLTTSVLARNGGPFDVASIVDLGATSDVGYAPDVEDRRFDPAAAVRTGVLRPTRFWSVLLQVARPTLADVFGENLLPRGRGLTVDVGKGMASLGCVRMSERARLYVEGEPIRLRVSLHHESRLLSLSVTDLRFYEPDHQTIRRSVARDVTARILGGVGVVLSVGLTRPWQRPGDSIARHWLQVNNIHLEDDAGWNDASCR